MSHPAPDYQRSAEGGTTPQSSKLSTLRPAPMTHFPHTPAMRRIPPPMMRPVIPGCGTYRREILFHPILSLTYA